MSPKKVHKVQAQQTDKLIQYVAIAVILIVAVLAAWPYLKNLPAKFKPVATEEPAASVSGSGATSSSAICKEFDSIPTASQYQQPPLKIDQAKQYFANVKMAKGGAFVIELYPAKAPITVNSFVFLACKGFYNGTTFHRVLEGFMAQGGDPTGRGNGGPGYQFINERSDLEFDKAGVVAMANSGPNTNGSQFFIMFGAYGLSADTYTIFGQVIEGMDVVNGITRRDPQTGPAFEGDAMESVTISEK
jgi:cyclophilin family peptidyl-prolyl cis-trans isomerase